MIQSVGMTAAAACILYMNITVEWHSIIYCSIGGIFGMIFGLEVIMPVLPGAWAKMYFVSIWAAFAYTLYLLNKLHGRTVYKQVPLWEEGVIYQNKWFTINKNALVLLTTGLFGGIFSSISGSGIDITSFACLTLMYRVTEKVATPTSVILMAINTCVGFYWRAMIQPSTVGNGLAVIRP